MCNKTHVFCVLNVGSQWTGCGKELMGTSVKLQCLVSQRQCLTREACYRWFGIMDFTIEPQSHNSNQSLDRLDRCGQQHSIKTTLYFFKEIGLKNVYSFFLILHNPKLELVVCYTTKMWFTLEMSVVCIYLTDMREQDGENEPVTVLQSIGTICKI